jgi:exodeoxyribonuclease VII large subunit
MERLPFDPEKTDAARRAAAKKYHKGADAGGGGLLGEGSAEKLGASQPASAKPAGPKAMTVSQLASLINASLDEAFPVAVKVVGEISNFSNRTHWYFAIKDAGSVLNCVMFAGRAKAAGFVPVQGQQVVITARVEVYEPSGRLTLNAEKIEPIGAGALDLELRRLIEELRGLGWLDEERKRRLPVFPRRVAVITSRKAAALADVKTTMAKRCPAVELCFFDVLVQGDGAASDITRAVRYVSQQAKALGIDAVLVTRGGGSMEDLWAFNDRALAQAIVECSIPVVAAIGHETDTTIAELVADKRASTPTQAAMFLTPDRVELAREVISTQRRLQMSVARVLREMTQRQQRGGERLVSFVRARILASQSRLERLAGRLERHRPAGVHAQRKGMIANLAQRLERAMEVRIKAARGEVARIDPRMESAIRMRLERARATTASAGRQLDLVGPVAVLRRGYSMTFDSKGQLVRGPMDVKRGEVMLTRLAEGQIESTVGKSEVAAVPKARRKGKGSEANMPGQGGLFDAGA